MQVAVVETLRAAELALAHRDGSLATFVKPDLRPAERTVAQVEGWILGVPALIRTAGKGEDSRTHVQNGRYRRSAWWWGQSPANRLSLQNSLVAGN